MVILKISQLQYRYQFRLHKPTNQNQATINRSQKNLMMGISTFHSFNIPRVNKFHINPMKPANYNFKRIPTVFSSYTETASVSDPSTPFQNIYKVEFKTLEGCKLGIWRYPIFEYNAKGGIGNGIGREKNDIIDVDFDVNNLYIPSMNGDTTKFLGLPLPPFLKIDIMPEILQGNINRSTGKVGTLISANIYFHHRSF